MHYLNPIFITPHLFGHKIQIQFKGNLFWKRNPWRLYFLNHNAHTSPLFRELNILNLPDKVALENCPFMNKYFNKYLPFIFKNWFTVSSNFYNYNTRWSNLGCIVVAHRNTKPYGRNAVNISAVYSWNHFQKLNENNLFISYHQISLR